MTVDELLNIPQLSQTSENTWKVDGLVIPKTWGQGRTAFGGISAGMLYTAVKQQVTDNRVLRSFTTNFVGPLSLEVPFSIEVTLLRTGKNVSQFTAHAIQDGKSCVFRKPVLVLRVSQVFKLRIQIHTTCLSRIKQSSSRKYLKLRLNSCAILIWQLKMAAFHLRAEKPAITTALCASNRPPKPSLMHISLL